MTAVSERYARVAGEFAQTAEAVPADRWGSPSPCEDWAARDVVRHVVGNHTWFLGFVDRQLPEHPSVDDNPAAAFQGASAMVQAALDDRATAETTVDAFGGPMAFEDAVNRFMCLDLVVHRWDLAHATGLDESLDRDEVKAAVVTAESFGDALRSPNVFGPALDPPAGADEQTRMLAFLGRRSWA